ncbi:MAG: hypothetical protein J6037_00185 [Bacteroidales bacterium]|nr:hypothetical protein [Bacteroidales bacterium]
MNNVFSAKRFGKYFLYDLNNAKNNFGISLLILGLLPVIIFMISQLFSLLFNGSFTLNQDASIPGRVTGAVVAVAVVVMAGPVKIYGHVTDKRAGSSFLMLPVSTFEKWLSMVLITVIILPVCLGVVYFGADTLMGLIFPNSFGKPIVSLPSDYFNTAMLGDIDIHFSLPGVMFANWAMYVLFFTLGAVVFKKAKVGKSILVLFGLFTLFSIILTTIVGISADADLEAFLSGLDMDPEVAVKIFLNFTRVIMALEIGTLLALIYARLRTIKQ